MEETKRQSKKELRCNISLKDIPPLDPSSIIPRRNPSSMAKERLEEENLMFSSMISNIQIDPNSTRRRSQLNPKPEEEEEDTSKKPKPKDESKKGSAKSMLNEICASSSKRWKPPLYECCKVEGPSHLRLFTYKVVVEIRDFSGTTTVLECFGDPKPKKKAAAEHAAQAALWYLKSTEKPL